MNYRITHKTEYQYAYTISLCHNEARILPRQTERQTCRNSMLLIDPEPSASHEREDFFNNRVCYFAIQHPHDCLSVTAISDVSIASRNTGKACVDIPWEDLRDRSLEPGNPSSVEACQFMLDSPLIPTSSKLAEYALKTFTPGRPVLDATQGLMQSIFEEFTYVPGFTTVTTSLDMVMEHRRGVCQDFAQVAIGCLRSIGLPARYVSGYLETKPPPGKPRLIGADASHAWFAVYVPEIGWVDFDPTNNVMPDDRHVTVAWGRDFSDVTPLKGVLFGSGDHRLTVSVDVAPCNDEP